MIQLPPTETEYLNTLLDFAEMAAQRALEKAGLKRATMRLKDAKELYGPAQVERWLREHLITKIKDGSNNSEVRIDCMQIEAVAKTSNRLTYMSTKERREKSCSK